MTDTERQKLIIDAARDAMRRDGVRFTIDELSHSLGMAKKTIYHFFPDKESLLCALVEDMFRAVKEAEETVYQNRELSVTERLRGILAVMPESYRGMDYAEMKVLKEKYPAVYSRVCEHLETGWERTLSLLKEGTDAGSFRPVDPYLFQLTYEAAVERFLQDEGLRTHRLGYEEALADLADLLVHGIVK